MYRRKRSGMSISCVHEKPVVLYIRFLFKNSQVLWYEKFCKTSSDFLVGNPRITHDWSMRPYFAKVSIGTGIEPILNWFQSTALIAQRLYYIGYNNDVFILKQVYIRCKKNRNVQNTWICYDNFVDKFII